MVFQGWCFTSNLQKHYNGRIVVAWNPNSFTVSILHTSAQCIHCVIKPRSGLPEFFCSFIYAFNEAENRDLLWQDLTDYAASIEGPWMIMGDLNCVLKMDERCGSNVRMQEILPGRMCMERCGLIDIPHAGQHFTWSNKQMGEDRVFSKIDRVMANEAWLEKFSRFSAIFLPEGISDHCPALVRRINDDSEGKKPFKYYRMWREAEGYKEQVKMAWEGKDQGSPMFEITGKLRRVKTWLKELNRVGFSTIQADAYQAYQQMIKAQQQAHNFPNDVGIAEAEKEAVREYKSKQKIYDQFLQQKAKCQWIREGDSNTSLFHKSIKQRRLQNTIYAIKDCNGVLQDNPSSIAGAFLEYYQNLLGVKEEGRQRVQQEVVGLGPVIQNDQKPRLISIPTHEEIRKTMYSIKGDKAPGPDGFGSYFYQDNWDLVGGEVCEAVVSFFRTGKLLREVNTTFLSLIPKINCPGDFTEFRPIACCNTIYKCITNIICNRLKIVLPNLIAANQGAFVHQRFIVHNIMVCQDLVRKYGRKNSSPSCLIKLDLRKAYDTVEWEFVQEMLESLGFPD
ncbi:hypothetical protein RDABS01_035830 [Bienertia sinuspersici]